MDGVANRRRIWCGPKMKCDRRRMREGCTEGRAYHHGGWSSGGWPGTEQIEYNLVYSVSVNGIAAALFVAIGADA